MITFDWECYFCSNVTETYDGFCPSGWEFVPATVPEKGDVLVVCCKDCYSKKDREIKPDGKA